MRQTLREEEKTFRRPDKRANGNVTFSVVEELGLPEVLLVCKITLSSHVMAIVTFVPYIFIHFSVPVYFLPTLFLETFLFYFIFFFLVSVLCVYVHVPSRVVVCACLLV